MGLLEEFKRIFQPNDDEIAADDAVQQQWFARAAAIKHRHDMDEADRPTSLEEGLAAVRRARK